jgi:DNA topoisomerase-1
MTDKLIIVESPAKANTIKKFLGGNTKVVASMGHIRDLPKSKLGVDEKTLEPQYINIRGKGDLIKTLKKDAKEAKKVYLATDPDREGEAIAWHLAYILGINPDEVCRVTFNEITKEAVKNAISKPRKIDMDLTDAQQARRVLDRIVGYKISPVLWKKVQKGLSAGRVQSVAVRLIVEREEEIENFKPEEYWNIYAKLKEPKTKKSFQAKLYGKDNKKIDIHTEAEVNKILEDLEKATYTVEEVKKGEKKRTPAPPFTTSTMQQEASRKLGFAIKKTMSVAQGLYEGVKIAEKGTVGLITYMRTDSTRISEEARKWAKDYIENEYGKEYYENRYYKTKAEAQDAHEAIRPTYIELSPEKVKSSLTNDQYKLYKLIYNRFIASQMSAAIYDTVAVKILADNYNLRANGQTLKFKGFMTLYVETADFEEKEEFEKIPELQENQELKKEKLESKQSFTEPPPRYTEASLVKTLEEKGIGRPSTYSPTITTILARRYIEKIQKQLHPTELGKIVNKLLVENFPDVLNVKFTAEMEEEFDKIAEGKEEWKKVIQEFYGPFKTTVEKVEKELEHVKLEYEVSDVPCEKCGRMMVIKYGKYGKFLACPGYPECKNAKPLIETIDEPCPKCGGKVQIRKTKKRRNYYICENNPTSCDYISWNKPGTEEKKTVKKKTARKAVKKKTTKKKSK